MTEEELLKRARIIINQIVYKAFDEYKLDDELRYQISITLFKCYKTGLLDGIKICNKNNLFQILKRK